MRPTGLALLLLAGAAAAQPIVIRTTSLIDGRGRVLRHQEIVREGSRIAAAKQKPTIDLSGTSVAAEPLRMGDRIGAVVEGMEADLVATAGNPFDDITAVRRVAFVMKGGKVVKEAGR